MPRIELTSHLAKHAECPDKHSVEGNTLQEALQDLFDKHPPLREQILDDTGRVVPHLAIFVDGRMIEKRDELGVAVRADSEVFIMQALSGG